MADGYVAKYKCKCGEHTFVVRYREKDENIVDWLENAVRPAMGEAHTKNNAMCTATNADLFLPIDEEGDGVGMKKVVH